MEKNQKVRTDFMYILLICCLCVIAAAFYRFYFLKEFDYIVETTCDPETQECFYRDCSVEGECPPNNLSYYSQYVIRAKDFNLCENEDCTEVCINGKFICSQIQCTQDDIDSGICLTPVTEAEI